MMDRTWGRRSLMSGLSAAAAVLTLRTQTAGAEPAAGPFQPARHAQDEWFDTMPGKHRVILDITSATGTAEGLQFASNLFVANKSGYGLDDADLAIVVGLRHFSTSFAFNDAFWAKHGTALADAARHTDAKATEAPVANPYNVAPRTQIDALVKRGVHFAICDMATHRISRQLAGPDGNADAIYKELRAHVIPNGHFVAAGVVGVTRAQEYGYSLLHVG